ncbi:MAG TPA: MotA/TolQ/ExbB proton channel family protein [Phycisphaerales bacterium]|nr:MotA/TolQ/ExbB proton channel family protein [Phycisphaerales bacterium]HMP37129.1 MotA/TolQ/ExbB proton channel family protein [Phycisphaerales bacterium]
MIEPCVVPLARIVALAAAGPPGSVDPDARGSLLRFVQGGGVVGYIIVALSIAALALCVVHAIQIRRRALMPPQQVDAIETMLERGEVEQAMQYCLLPSNDSYLTRIIGAGLARYLRSAFGAFEVKTALEEAGEEQTARLYRSTDAIGVIGSIAPLLGLLGTVQGMIGAFETVAGAASSANYYEQLAGNISLALITTLQGLIVAIPCVALFSFFRNRIDAVASEASATVERLAILLEAAPGTGRPTQGGRAGA